MTEKDFYEAKCIVLGNAMVGKTSVIARGMEDVFDERTKPTVVFLSHFNSRGRATHRGIML